MFIFDRDSSERESSRYMFHNMITLDIWGRKGYIDLYTGSMYYETDRLLPVTVIGRYHG